MIGVIADPADHAIVREFFELFKTPWEFFRPHRTYKVVLCSVDQQVETRPELLVHYNSKRTQIDEAFGIQTGAVRTNACIASSPKGRLPIYGASISFPMTSTGRLSDERTSDCLGQLVKSKNGFFARLGYDLFAEVLLLLTAGQPEENAALPAMELHIDLLRRLVTQCGIAIVEVPPVPEGYAFAVCLTHDVDHPAVRNHKWDHTTFGFFHRAIFGSVREFIQGRICVADLLKNWWAALTLPFVHIGIFADFWRNFAERYLQLEEGLPSTFFIIPFRDRPGRTLHGHAPGFRAAKYGAKEIADIIANLRAHGAEVALHGIDAWLDSASARAEMDEIRTLTGTPELGVRMHWLYYGEQSPAILEQAGACYDATIGYNGVVGYRSGTTQAYKPLQATRLLELPLHVMDTALFYPAHMGLPPREGSRVLSELADITVQFGGCFTINWHDRSLAPERQWDSCYRQMIEDLKARGAWFCYASQAVSWFRKRRSVVFEADAADPETVRARVSETNDDHIPALLLRIHKADEPDRLITQDQAYIDRAFCQEIESPAAYAL